MTIIEHQSPILGSDHTLVEDLGMESFGDLFTPLLKRGSSVPCKITQKFTTANDQQKTIEIAVYRGVGDMISENKYLGWYRIKRPSGSPKEVLQVLITFEVLASGDICIEAADAKSGAALPILPAERNNDLWDW